MYVARALLGVVAVPRAQKPWAPLWPPVDSLHNLLVSHATHTSYKRHGVRHRHDDIIICGHGSRMFEACLLHTYMHFLNMSEESSCMTNLAAPSYEEGLKHCL